MRSISALLLALLLAGCETKTVAVAVPTTGLLEKGHLTADQKAVFSADKITVEHKTDAGVVVTVLGAGRTVFESLVDWMLGVNKAIERARQ